MIIFPPSIPPAFCSRCRKLVGSTTGLMVFPEVSGHPVVCAPCVFSVLTDARVGFTHVDPTIYVDAPPAAPPQSPPWCPSCQHKLSYHDDHARCHVGWYQGLPQDDPPPCPCGRLAPLDHTAMIQYPSHQFVRDGRPGSLTCAYFDRQLGLCGRREIDH